MKRYRRSCRREHRRLRGLAREGRRAVLICVRADRCGGRIRRRARDRARPRPRHTLCRAPADRLRDRRDADLTPVLGLATRAEAGADDFTSRRTSPSSAGSCSCS